jgi:hypothetical protein
MFGWQAKGTLELERLLKIQCSKSELRAQDRHVSLVKKVLLSFLGISNEILTLTNHFKPLFGINKYLLEGFF